MDVYDAVDVYEADVVVEGEDVAGGNPKMTSRFVLDQFRLKPY